MTHRHYHSPQWGLSVPRVLHTTLSLNPPLLRQNLASHVLWPGPSAVFFPHFYFSSLTPTQAWGR